MNQEEKLKKVQEILKSHGIRMNVGGCGCCTSPWVRFEYKGEVILDAAGRDGNRIPAGDSNFDMFEEE